MTDRATTHADPVAIVGLGCGFAGAIDPPQSAKPSAWTRKHSSRDNALERKAQS